MRFLIFLLTFVSITCFGFTDDSSQHKQKQILQNFLTDMLQHRKSPWGVTAVSMVAQCKENKPILVYGGFTSINNKISINEDSLFPIASITKSFISVVILQLADEYKLNLDSQEVIKKYFPEYPTWGNITVRQLLTMTSGIAGTSTGASDDIFNKMTVKKYESYISPRDILNKVYQIPLHFKPGTQWEYSNTNYILLGMLIEKITHQRAMDEVQKRIIHPLGLHHTYFPADKLKSIPGLNQSNIVHGYAFYPKDHIPYVIKFGQDTVDFSFSQPSYAGGIVSTPKDINIYLHALYQSNKLLNKSQLKEFMTLVSRKNGKPFAAEKSPDDFGFGFGVFGYYSKSQNAIIYFYQGSLEGYQFYYFYNPKTQLYLAFGINTRSDIIGKNNSMKLIDALNDACSDREKQK